MDRLPSEAVAYLQARRQTDKFMEGCTKKVDDKTKVGSFFSQVQRNNPALAIREKMRCDIYFSNQKVFASTCFNFKKHLPKLHEHQISQQQRGSMENPPSTNLDFVQS